jgi:hypothetical protein
MPTNNQKIKSITIKDREAEKALLHRYRSSQAFIDFVNDNKDLFEIEYESEKPKLLKRADGSLITEPKYLERILLLELCFSFRNNNGFYKPVYHDYERSYHKPKLQQGLIFLPEDVELAEKKAKMLTKQLEIQFEIDRVNAEGAG